MRWCLSRGRISPPPPVTQRKYDVSAGPSTTFNESIPNTVNNGAISRNAENQNQNSNIKQTFNRVKIASKQLLDDNDVYRPAQSFNDDHKVNDIPNIRSDEINSVSKSDRSFESANSLISASNGKQAFANSPKLLLKDKGRRLQWLLQPDINQIQRTSSSNESDLESNALNTQLIEEAGSTSPSSSGIVADINDSSAENNQQTSATSSPSSCEPLLDQHEPGYDTPQPGRTYRVANDIRISSELLQSTQGMRPQLLDLKNVHDISRSALDEKRGSCTSALQNMLNSFDDLNNISTPKNQKNGSPSNVQKTFNVKNRSIVGVPMRHNINTTFVFPTGHSSFESEDNSKYLGGNETARKQMVCSKLSENYRLIEIAVKKIAECTAPRGWRQTHIIQKHLFDLKESVETIAGSLSYFLNAACRITFDGNHLKAEDLKQLLTPLQNMNAVICELKRTLDNTGWTLAALSRPRSIYGPAPANDALDQFIELTKQLPSECCKLVEWTFMLLPSSGVRFLINGLENTSRFEYLVPSNIYQPASEISITSIGNGIEELKRISAISTASSLTISSADENLATTQHGSDATKNRLHFASNNENGEIDDFMNRNMVKNRVKFANASSLNNINNNRLSNAAFDTHVFEEDDLESITSDRDSVQRDSFLAKNESAMVDHRKRISTYLPPTPQLSTEALNALSDDDRQLIKFYSPQLDSYTESLTKEIDDFLIVIEDQKPPHEFVKSGKMIILAAHKLIYIGDNIAQCVTSSEVSILVRSAADRLCEVLKNCVQATKRAADEYPHVAAVQTMVDCIVTVSHAAHDLKLLVKQCI